jgi:preprotein translocase subunit SecG
MTQTIFTTLQIISALLLIGAVLLQQKGSGLGAAFGGSSNIYSTKRGIDKVLFYFTIVISVVFFGISLARLFLA